MKFSKVLTLLAFIPILLGGETVPDGMFTSRIVEETNERNVILEMSFTNTSNEALCVYHWVPLSNKIYETLYGNAFLIRDSDGSEPEYLGARVEESSEDTNKRAFVVVPGKNLKANYNLAKLYKLNAGEYSVTFYLSAINCKAFDQEWSYLYSPITLRGLVSEYGYDLKDAKELYKGMDSRMKQSVNIYKMDPVEFVIAK